MNVGRNTILLQDVVVCFQKCKSTDTIAIEGVNILIQLQREQKLGDNCRFLKRVAPHNSSDHWGCRGWLLH